MYVCSVCCAVFCRIVLSGLGMLGKNTATSRFVSLLGLLKLVSRSGSHPLNRRNNLAAHRGIAVLQVSLCGS
jgi:hypothetical protein